MAPQPDSWEPSVSFRLPRATLQRILDLRPVLGGVETATTSATMRELLELSLVVFDTAAARRVAEYSRHAGLSRDAAWQRVVDGGLDCLASAHDTE